jgi:hypothetical protein
MKIIAGIMAEMIFVVRLTRDNMSGAPQTTIDVCNAQMMVTARLKSLIAIGTWNVRNAL